ncbi:MAG TPA: hypothetical protein DHU81_10675 [Hyphomonas sp.]|nr:hypothetical protein [Hyphomonas sp.]
MGRHPHRERIVTRVQQIFGNRENHVHFSGLFGTAIIGWLSIFADLDPVEVRMAGSLGGD